MQAKHTRYLLISAVAIVWAIVLYKIINAGGGESTLITTSSKKQSSNKSIFVYEEYELLADYNDPFRLSTSKKYAENTDPKEFDESSVNEHIEVDEPVDISFIRYLGSVSNQSNKKKAAIVSIRGKEVFVRVNEKIDGLQINSIQKDKIRITYLGKRYWIQKNN